VLGESDPKGLIEVTQVGNGIGSGEMIRAIIHAEGVFVGGTGVRVIFIIRAGRRVHRGGAVRSSLCRKHSKYNRG